MIQCNGQCCPDCGQVSEPEVVVVEAGGSDVAAAEASVEIARIEAGSDVAIAKIQSRGMDEDMAAMMAGMAARIEVLETALAPEPEPEPIIMPMEPPAAAPAEPVMEPPETAPKAESRKTGKKGFFG